MSEVRHSHSRRLNSLVSYVLKHARHRLLQRLRRLLQILRELLRCD